jgi:dihydrofolate reductase
VIAIVVAHAANRVIGRDGGLPWHIPTDLKRFRELTTGQTVVMGRRTYESLPERFRPLPNRRNIVLSSDPEYRADGAEVFPGLAQALEACGHDCWVIGGGVTYEQALPLAERVYATQVEESPAGDAFFPPLGDGWRVVEESGELVENDHRFSFRTYERAVRA